MAEASVSSGWTALPNALTSAAGGGASVSESGCGTASILTRSVQAAAVPVAFDTAAAEGGWALADVDGVTPVDIDMDDADDAEMDDAGTDDAADGVAGPEEAVEDPGVAAAAVELLTAALADDGDETVALGGAEDDVEALVPDPHAVRTAVSSAAPHSDRTVNLDVVMSEPSGHIAVR